MDQVESQNISHRHNEHTASLLSQQKQNEYAFNHTYATIFRLFVITFFFIAYSLRSVADSLITLTISQIKRYDDESESTLSLKINECVRWKWKTPDRINGIQQNGMMKFAWWTRRTTITTKKLHSKYKKKKMWKKTLAELFYIMNFICKRRICIAFAASLHRDTTCVKYHSHTKFSSNTIPIILYPFLLSINSFFCLSSSELHELICRCLLILINANIISIPCLFLNFAAQEQCRNANDTSKIRTFFY